MSPWWLMSTRLAIARPSPVPSGLPVRNESKIRPLIASGIPEPVSDTSMTAWPPDSLASDASLRVITPPPGIACIELIRRLSSTCCSCPLCPSTTIDCAGGSNSDTDVALGELEADQDERVGDDLGDLVAGVQACGRLREVEHPGHDRLELVELLPDHAHVGAPGIALREVRAQAAVQELEHRERVADLVGDLGGQESKRQTRAFKALNGAMPAVQPTQNRNPRQQIRQHHPFRDTPAAQSGTLATLKTITAGHQATECIATAPVPQLSGLLPYTAIVQPNLFGIHVT